MANEKVFLWINRDLLEFYALYVGILLLKCFVMIVHVGLSRVYYKAPRNPEDGSVFNVKVYKNENVERNRRAHLNDLENIPLFIAVSFLYLLTEPSIEPTKWIIRVYVLSRIIYTLAYIVYKSVWRVVFFEIGLFTNFYLCASVIYHFAGKF